ncbi:hypothetical protein HY251_13735 [bacterium]|nr:hypothetical protein [bacterium]
MDFAMRSLQRRANADPSDGAAAARLARTLARAGRADDARATVRGRVAQGEIDGDTLGLVLELGVGLIDGGPASAPCANVRYAPHRPAERVVELTPVVAFAGVPGSGARESALALRDLFAARILECQEMRVDDERAIDFTASLVRPWTVARTYAVRSLRVVTVPVAQHAVKLRRRVLRETSALAFVVDSRGTGQDGYSNEQAWKVLKADFRRSTGKAIDGLPLVFQYHDPVEEAWHRALMLALGLSRIPHARTTATIETSAPDAEPGAPRFARVGDEDRVLAHDGAVESLALLLVGIAAAVRGLTSPRPRCLESRGTPPGALPRP